MDGRWQDTTAKIADKFVMTPSERSELRWEIAQAMQFAFDLGVKHGHNNRLAPLDLLLPK